jgi:hypothetical protein
VKTRRAAIAAGLMAGVAALPLTASAQSASDAPQGSATASTVSVNVSLAPIASTVNGTGVLSGLASAFETLKATLCPTSPVGCDLTIPNSLPLSLAVKIAQANATGVYNATATDVTSGQSSASPVTTDWHTLNVDIQALEDELTNLIQGSATQLATNGVAGLTGFLSSNGPGKLTLSSPLGTADFHILGTVAANLNWGKLADRTNDSANAVRVTIDNGSLPASVNGSLVSVDPFHAYAMNAAAPATSDGVTGPQVSAANTSVGVHLPALTVAGVNASNLSSLATELKSLIDALSKAIADPSSAGNILSSVPGVPPALQGPLTTIGGLVNQTVGTVTGAAPVANTVDISALKQWDATLSAALDGLRGVINAVADLPSVTDLVTSTDNIATTQTAPRPQGGIKSTATAALGSLAVLPIGGSLSGLLSNVLKNVTPTTPLIEVKGITSSASAEVGPGSTSPTGTGGLGSLTVLGQTIDLQNTLGLGAGQEIVKQLRFPGLGANGGDGWLTLRITRGLPQIVADTDTNRAVTMAELAISLSNGCGGSCTDSLGLPTTTAANANVAPHTASTGGGTTGIQALGGDADLVGLGISNVTAAVSMNGLPCSANCDQQSCHGPGTGPTCPDTANIASLPKTGMLGGFAIPAGLLLIAVAISLRLVPSLRTRARRMR